MGGRKKAKDSFTFLDVSAVGLVVGVVEGVAVEDDAGVEDDAADGSVAGVVVGVAVCSVHPLMIKELKIIVDIRRINIFFIMPPLQ